MYRKPSYRDPYIHAYFAKFFQAFPSNFIVDHVLDLGDSQRQSNVAFSGKSMYVHYSHATHQNM